MLAMSQPVLIVLAAWPGRDRLGDAASLVRGWDWQTILLATLRRALASELSVLLVANAGLAEAARGLLSLRDIVVEPACSEGAVGESRAIATGVGARPNAAGWIVLPGDMPLVQPASIQAVARGLEQAPVVYARHRGRSGHPIGFAGELYSELIHLSDGDGTRRLRSRYPAQGVDVADPGVLVDVDEVDEFDLLRGYLGGDEAPGLFS